MKEKNAPLIQAIEQQERQLEIDQAVKIALEQKIRETATPTPKPTPEPTITIEKNIVISPLLQAENEQDFILRMDTYERTRLPGT